MKNISNIANSGLKTVKRALRLLEWIGGTQGQDPTVREAAEALGLNITTCYHIVNTLAAAGYLVRGTDRCLRLGPQIAVLHQAFHQRLQPARELLALLQDLGRQARETVYLSTWDRGNVILQAVVEAPEALRVAGLYVGLRGAMHCRAGGKAILAYLSLDEVDVFVRENSLKAHTPNTITNPSALRAALQEIRAQGYAIDNQEFALGVCCAAAPYFDAAAKVKGAVAVSMPASRFETSRDHICRLVLEAGRKASSLLGYVNQYPPSGHASSRARTIEAGGRSCTGVLTHSHRSR